MCSGTKLRLCHAAIDGWPLEKYVCIVRWHLKGLSIKQMKVLHMCVW